jgi:uncharacterized protein (TIGR03435 family)
VHALHVGHGVEAARVTLAVAACALLSVAPASAQRGEPAAPRFDVVSIREIPAPDDPRRITCGLPGIMPLGNRIRIPSAQLCGLIRTAYDVGEFQIAGIPEGMGIGATNFFTVEALIENVTAPPGIEDIRARLRTLLSERFQLRVRRAPVDMPVYALVTDGGPKAKSCADPKSETGYVTGRIASCTPLLPMARFTQFLSRETGRMVLDKTGVEPFPFELLWTPDTPPPLPDAPAGLFTAIREQLGLRLEAQRAPVDSIIVEHAERPSPN